MRSFRWMLPSLLCLIGLLPALSRAAVPSLQQPNAYAVVIGISQYREEVIPTVPYAVKDAQAIAQLLEKQGGIPKSHIKLLTDSKATFNDIRNHVGDWLRMRVRPDSTVYIYYAGHGTPNPLTGEAYLVPWEGHPDFPSGLYPVKDLYATLNALPAQEIVVLLDSCFSGAAGRSILAKGTRPMVITLENPLLAGGKVAVLAASTGTQVSSDYDKAGHGLFTHAVLTGLRGAADTDKNGLVTLKELYPYVRDRVTTTAVDELNREQTPVLLPGEESLGTRSALPIALAVPSTAMSQAEQELKALEAQEQAVDEQAKHATLQRQIEEKKRQIEEKKKKLEVASLPSYSAPKKTGREITGKDGAPMLLVPEGEFLYGDDKQRESAPVSDFDAWMNGEFLYGDDKQRKSLSAFYMDKFEVSTAQYAKFMGAGGAMEPQDWPTSVLVSHGQKPVVGVSWHDADAYCRHYGKRLPTEQEWEKAARGTDGRTYPWGNDEPTRRHANFNRGFDFQNYGILVNVGSLEAGKSPYGIYDMAGNVWEWTSSDYDSSKKVFRGGSWLNDTIYLRTSSRSRRTPDFRINYLGFRCAQDAH